MNRLSTPRIPERIFSVSLHRFHKLIGGGHGDIEIVEVAISLFTLDELENVRVIHPKDAHICSPASPPLFDRLGSCIEDAHEGDRTAGDAFRRTHHIIFRPDPGERKPGPAAALLDQGHLFHRIEDLLHRIPHRQDKAGGELLEFPPSIHQRGGIGKKIQGSHQGIEFFFDRRVVRLRGIEAIGLGNISRHTLEHVLRFLGHLPMKVSLQVTFFKHG